MVREKSSSKKEKLLSAALELFVEKGVQNTSTAEIARKAGIATGTLFLYFPTKQDLIHQLALNIGREQSDFIHTLLQPDYSAYESFATIWNGSIRWLLENMDAYQFNQQIRDSGMISEEVVQESAQFFRYYYEAIQKGLQEGIIKPLPADLIGGFLYQDIVAVMNLIRIQPDDAKISQVIQMGFEIFWDGIKTQ